MEEDGGAALGEAADDDICVVHYGYDNLPANSGAGLGLFPASALLLIGVALRVNRCDGFSRLFRSL